MNINLKKKYIKKQYTTTNKVCTFISKTTFFLREFLD